jgi:hypothetical protein
LSIQKIMARKADNDRGMPNQTVKKTGITSDQEPKSKE